MLLYGLEVFLSMCEKSSNSSKLQKAGVRRIYRPPSLVAVAHQVLLPLLQRLAENSKPSDEPMPLHGVASVHPVTLRLEVAVELLTADVITPMVCTDASPVQPVLKTWFLRDLHRLWNTVCPMHRCL